MKRFLIALIIALFLISTPAIANWWQLQTTISTSASADWSRWDELSEVSLASNDIFVVLFENPAGSGSEIGEGGSLSVGERTLTAYGDPSGATETYRILDGVGDYFSATTGMATLVEDNTWTIVMKTGNVSTVRQAAWFGWADTGNEQIQISTSNGPPYGDNTWFTSRQDTVSEQATGVSAYPTESILYVAMWTDGVDLRAGWTTSGSGSAGQPTKWSDFIGPSGATRFIFSVNTGDYTGELFDNYKNFFKWEGANELACHAYYIVISKSGTLINNNQ